MSRKQKAIRWIVSGTLLAAVALVGVTVYRVETSQMDQMEQEENQVAQVPTPVPEEQPEESENATEQVQPNHAVIEEEEEIVPEETPQETPQTEDTASSDVSAQMDEAEESASTDVETPVLPELNFTEDTLMEWPVGGEILMDYSMDHTIYFPTLEVYKYNPSIVVSASSGEPVFAAANSRIVSVEEAPETGTTVTVDMGNGYQAVYGQLKDVQVAAEDVISAGTVLGNVNDPTKFYAEEGTNLYFSMTKDGESVDPILYLP